MNAIREASEPMGGNLEYSESENLNPASVTDVEAYLYTVTSESMTWNI